MLSEDEQYAAVEAIAAAAYDPREWSRALEWIAKAGEGWCAQLIGVSPRGVQFHAAHGVTGDMTDEFDRRGGANPAINPRARIFTQKVNAICRDLDLATPEELRRSEFMNDFLYRDGGDDVLGVRLPTLGATNSCVIVARSRKQLDQQVREDQYRLLLRFTHEALRLSAAVDGRGIELVRNTLSGLDLTAFIADGSGRIVGLTAPAEALLENGDLLRLTRRGIAAADLRSNAKLQDALAMACAKPDSSGAPSRRN